MRIVVVGGGILGVATARALAGEHDVLLLEKEPALGQHQSSRNSGVVHAGIYYAAGSLKARLCRAGGERLRAFCEAHSLRYEACGKVVVARDDRELERLKALEDRASANGVPGLAWLDEAALHELEPHVNGIAALHSPSSAIVDFGAVVRAMAGEVTDAGGEIRLNARGHRGPAAGRPGRDLACGWLRARRRSGGRLRRPLRRSPRARVGPPGGSPDRPLPGRVLAPAAGAP